MIEVTPARGEKDGAVVRYILNHPRIWPRLFDEPLPQDWLPQENGLFLLVRRDGASLGVAILSPENSITCQVHHAVLPKAWGAFSVHAGLEVMRYIFAAKWQCVTGWTPVNNRPALRFAKALGMEASGICPASYEERGKVYDRQHFYLTRARWEALERMRADTAACTGRLDMARRLLAAAKAADTQEKWTEAARALESDGIPIGRYGNAFHMRETLIAQLTADRRLFEGQMQELNARWTRC